MNRLAGATALLLAFALWFAPDANAHRVGIPVTTVEWNSDALAWDVVHRLSAHDFAEEIDGLDNADFSLPETQILLGEYIVEHFTLIGESQQIEISFLGAEEDADSFYVYFQLVSDDQTLQVRNELITMGQGGDRRHALLNMTNGKSTKTLFFTSSDTDKQLDLVRPLTD